MFKNKIHEELRRSWALPSTTRIFQHHKVTGNWFSLCAGWVMMCYRKLVFLAVSKQSRAWMENSGCILVGFIIMINKWFTLMSIFPWNTPRWILYQGDVCRSPVRCAAPRRKWMLMQHKWSLIQWCVWVLGVYCQDNERGCVFCIYKIHLSIGNGKQGFT